MFLQISYRRECDNLGKRKPKIKSRKKVDNSNIQITKHVNDVIQKHAIMLFRDATLEFYGIKTAPIVELINPELPTIQVSGGAADIVFLLADGSYLHFAFETGYSRSKLIQILGYDSRLYERDGRTVHTVVIYTSDVKTKPAGLKIGSLEYNPDIIMMGDYDGDVVYAELETKIKNNQELSDSDMLNLVLLPLMKHTIPRSDLAANSIKLAQAIPDATKRTACIAAAFAFADKYLDRTEMNKLMEAIRVTELAVMLVEDAVNDITTEIAKNAIREGLSIDVIKRLTGLDESTIKDLQGKL